MLYIPVPLGTVVFAELEFIKVHRDGYTTSRSKGSANGKCACLCNETQGLK